MHETHNDRSLGELFADLAHESSTLVRQEIELARAELSDKAASFARDVAFLAIGGAVLYAGLLAVLAALIIVLGSAGVPWWLSALLGGIIVLGVGYGLIHR